MLNKFYEFLPSSTLRAIAITGFVVAAHYPCMSDGIDQTYEAPDIASTNTLSSEELTHVAARCRQEILQTHQLRTSVPLHRAREYAITLSLASDKCEAMIKTSEALQQAVQDYQEYNKNLQHARMSASMHDVNINKYVDMPVNINNDFAEPPTIHSTEHSDFTAPHNNQIIEEDLSSHARPTPLH